MESVRILPEIEMKDYKPYKIEDYEDLKKYAKPLSHFRIQRVQPINYSHHFLVIGISPVRDGVDSVVIAHYTSSLEIACGHSSNMGKFERETYLVDTKSGKSVPGGQKVDPLDFPNLYCIDEPNYPETDSELQVAIQRLEKRMGEQKFKLSWNNCESAVHFILTGQSKSKQVIKRRTCVNIVDVLLLDCKELGFRMALLASVLGAIAGSLVRRAYVKIITAAIVSFSTKMALNSNCLRGAGNNLIEEAKIRIEQAEKIPDVAKIIDYHDVEILSQIQLHLNSSGFICNLTASLAKEACDKTFKASLLVSFGVETVLYMSYLCFSIMPFSGSLTRLEWTRIVSLHIFAGYTSLYLASLIGCHIFAIHLRPALNFFFSFLLSGLGFRYLLTIVYGILFDFFTGTLYGCNFSFCRCEHSCCNIWTALYKCFHMKVFCVRLIIYLIMLITVLSCVTYITLTKN